MAKKPLLIAFSTVVATMPIVAAKTLEWGPVEEGGAYIGCSLANLTESNVASSFRKGSADIVGGISTIGSRYDDVSNPKYVWRLAGAGVYGATHVVSQVAPAGYGVSEWAWFPVLESIGPDSGSASYDLSLSVEAYGFNKLSKTMQITAYASEISTIDAVDLPATVGLPNSMFPLSKGGTCTYGWFGESAITADGIDAAQSGLCNKGQTSVLIGYVRAPMRIRFKWLKVGDDDDTLKFYSNWNEISSPKDLETCGAARSSKPPASASSFSDIATSRDFVRSRDYIFGTNGYHHTFLPEYIAWEFKRGNSELNLQEVHAGFVDNVEITRLRQVKFMSHGGSLVDWIWAVPGERFSYAMPFPDSPKKSPRNACGEENAYVFEGWFTDTERVFDDDLSGPRINGTGTQILWLDIVPEGTDAIILHARWRLVKPNACYGGASGGSGSGSGSGSGDGQDSGGNEPDDCDSCTAPDGNICTLMLNANGGMVSPDRRFVAKGSAIGFLPEAEREGYEFMGWWTTLDGGVQITGRTVVNGNATYYAHWEKEPDWGVIHTVVFNANGGVVDVRSRMVVQGMAIGTLPIPTRTDCVFDGWWTDASGGAQVTAESKIMTDTTLYAHWTQAVDLRFVTPSASAWEAPMFISVATEDHMLIDTVVEGQAIYLNYAFQNFSTKAVSGFKNVFRLNNGVEFWQDWSSYEVKSLKNGGLEMVAVKWLQNLKPGKYTLSCTLNDERTLKESDYSNNTYTISFTVVSRDSVKYDLGFAAWDGYKPWSTPLFLSATHSGEEAITSFAQGDTVYIKCGCKNLAASTDVTGFKIAARLNNGVAFTNYYYTTTVLGGGGVGVPQYWHPRELSNLSPGTYTMTVTLDADNAIMETDESNNSRSLTFTVVGHFNLDEVEGAAPAVTSEYNGYLYDGNSGAVKGTIQVKVGKANAKTGLAAVKATVVGLDGKKKSLKGAEKGKAAIAVDGPTTIRLVGGEPCEVTLGAEGLSGTYGPYLIDGVRNFFTSKDKGEQNSANAILSKWLGVINVAWREDGAARSASAPYQTSSVAIGKKGKAKVYVTLANGTKAMVNTQLLVGEEWLCVPVVVTKKMNLAFTLWLPRNGGAAVVEGLPGDVVVGKAGALKAGAKFHIDAEEFSARWGQRALPYLPDGVAVTANGTRWTLPKAGKVQMAKDGTVDAAKLGGNLAALKLTYKAKDGSFKGSFKAYSLVNGKPKAVTVNVAGVVVDGVGYGTATVKKVGSVPISIE